MHLIGIDLGGTKTEGIVMTRDGRILARHRIPTPGHLGYEPVIEAIRRLVLALECDAGEPCSVGVCTPGSISSHTGLLKNSNTTSLNNRDIKADIQAALDRPVLIENDANCFTLSEATDGAARTHGVVFGIILGTGVGGGIVLDKQLHPGRHHIAGEWGHNILEPGGPECYCGRRGCVETFLSGPGFVAGWPREHNRPRSAVELVEWAHRGDADAVALLDRFLLRFGRALATVINILDPDAVVLGGGLSNIEELYTRGADVVREHVFNDQFNTAILKNLHGDSSGVRGAARLWSARGRNDLAS